MCTPIPLQTVPHVIKLLKRQANVRHLITHCYVLFTKLCLHVCTGTFDSRKFEKTPYLSTPHDYLHSTTTPASYAAYTTSQPTLPPYTRNTDPYLAKTADSFQSGPSTFTAQMYNETPLLSETTAYSGETTPSFLKSDPTMTMTTRAAYRSQPAFEVPSYDSEPYSSTPASTDTELQVCLRL